MEKHYAAGDIIIRREQISPYLVRIDTGKVRMETTEQLWFLSDGDIFGEEGVLLGRPALYTAQAAEETTVTLFTDAESASRFLAENPATALLAIHRNAAREHGPTPPLSPDNPHYLHLLRRLLPHAPAEGDPNGYGRAAIDIERLAMLSDTSREALERLVREAASFGDVSLADDGAILVKGAEHLRLRLAEARCTAFFAGDPARAFGRGRYNLLSRMM